MTPCNRELLGAYVLQGSQDAFAQIVGRYSDLVHGAALRRTRKTYLADDVTQAVFIILARRARSVPPEHLAGWLLRTTRFCAHDAMKMQARREHHERQAAAMKPLEVQPEDSTDEPIAKHLDRAIAQLRPKESSAVSMRYLQNKSTTTVAEEMGITVDAAQKVIARSIVKLRRILLARGVTVPSTIALGTVMIRFADHAASPALAGVISSPAQGSTSAAARAIAKNVGRFTILARRGCIALVAGILFLAGIAAQSLSKHHSEVVGQQPAPAAVSRQPLLFSSPFLELVGCRIKQNLRFDLAASIPSAQQPVITEHQLLRIEWMVNPAVAGAGTYWNLIVLRVEADLTGASKYAWQVTGIPADVTSVVYGQAPINLRGGGIPMAASRLAIGDYLIRLSQVRAAPIGSSQPEEIRQAELRFRVEPMPVTTIAINDVHRDGTSQYVKVIQGMNYANQTLGVNSGGFVFPDSQRVQSVVDDDGLPVRFGRREQGIAALYDCVLNKPVASGEPFLLRVEGMCYGTAGVAEDPELTLSSQSSSDTLDRPSRLLELFRLPRGARVTETVPPDLPQRMVDGQIQVFAFETVAPGEHQRPIRIQYVVHE